MKRFYSFIPFVVVVASMTGLILTQPSTAKPEPCQTQSFQKFSHRVWDKQRWQRGAPKEVVAKAQRKKLDCVGKSKLQKTWRHDKKRFYHERQRCLGGRVIKGRVSYFGGGLMASGHYTSEPAIALNIAPGTEWGWNNSTTRNWVGRQQRFWVTIQGHKKVLFAGDLGPAGFTQRAIDVTEGGVAKLGVSALGITDSIGTAQLIPGGCL